MALLAGLDTVAWGELSHAYGPATDVPDLLRALVDPDQAAPAIRKGAKKADQIRPHVMWTLWGNVYHQGTVWQATPHVIPFLVEILADGPSEPELQLFLLSYLHHVALGFPQDMFPHVVEPHEYFAVADQQPEDPDDPYDSVYMAGYGRACYRAVEAALPTIGRFTTGSDHEVALAAIALLGSFRGEAAAGVLRRVVLEQEGRRRAITLVALAQLDPATTISQATPLLAEVDRYVAVHAACALLLADAMNVQAIAIVMQPLGDLTEERSPLTDSVGKLVSACLARLPTSQLERAVDAIGTSLASSNAMTNLSSTGSLLALVFPDGKAPQQASTLTPVQRQALEHIAAHGAFECNGGSFGNYFLLLRGCGVPGSRDELRAWLAA